MKAAKLAKRPKAIKSPPTSSMTPASPMREASWTVLSSERPEELLRPVLDEQEAGDDP